MRQFKRLRDSRSPHLCKKKSTCFACRRFFQTSLTYLNSAVEKNFCDKLVTKENSFFCPICNCQIYSTKCYIGHKQLCKSKGYFGYKCNDCNKFTYCQNNTTFDVKANHICHEGAICKFCFTQKEKGFHQCPLKFEIAPKFLTRLGFFKFVADDEGLPLLAIFYREENERGSFKKYVFLDPTINWKISNGPDEKVTSYLLKEWPLKKDFNTHCKISKTSTFFQQIQSLREDSAPSLANSVLTFLLDERYVNTTFICEDSNGSNLVSETYLFH